MLGALTKCPSKEGSGQTGSTAEVGNETVLDHGGGTSLNTTKKECAWGFQSGIPVGLYPCGVPTDGGTRIERNVLVPTAPLDLLR